MKFVYPEFLWSFGVLLIPIIIHLFNFRKYKTIYFSSIQFIKSVDKETRSTQKIKHLLVLISRLLLFICIVLAFAQPFIPVTNLKNNGGKPVLAVYIDNSFSMTMKGSEGELLNEAREMAKNMIQKVSADTRIMLVTNEMSGIEQRLVTKIEAIERLDKIDVCPLTRKLDEIINWEKIAIQSENDTKQKVGIKQFVIFSDFQKSTAVFNTISEDKESFYYPVLLKPQNVSNLTVDSVWFSNQIQRVGLNNEINVRLRNFSDDDLVNIDVKLELEGIKRDVFVDVLANNYVVTTFNYTEQGIGNKKGKVSVDDRQFFVDDDYYFSYSVSEKSNLLIINGEDAVDNIGVVYSLDQYYHTRIINQNQLTLGDFNNVDLVLVNGVNEITSGFSNYLFEFNQNGGSVALFPGNRVDLISWNTFLSKIKMPVFTDVISNEFKVQKINYQDEFFKPVFQKTPVNINLPVVKRIYKINPSLNSLYLTLIELNNGQPLLLKSSSKTPVYLYSSSLNSSFSSITSNALFSTVLLRMSEVSKRRVPISLIIGEDTKFPVFKTDKGESPLHLKAEGVDYIPQTINQGGIEMISISGLEAMGKLKAGTYQIEDETKEGLMSLNYSRNESNINCYSLSDIESKFEEKGVKNIKLSVNENNQNFARIDVEKPHEYWRIFIGLAILFAVIEILLLKFLKK